MSTAHPPGRPNWAPVLAAVALAAGAAATLRPNGPPRTAAEKYRVATAYEDVGDEPCYLCFGRIKEPRRITRDCLFARTPSQDPVVAYCIIYVCAAHPRPIEAEAQQRALKNWQEVQIEWWREKIGEGVAFPHLAERKIRDFEGACLTTPAWVTQSDLP